MKGILTGASDYTVILELFLASCKEQGFPVAVFDDGLGDNLEKIEQNATILHYPRNAFVDRVLKNMAKTNWESDIPFQAFEKPFKCQHSCFDQTIWIDADAIPLRGIDKMFELLDRQEAFFTGDHYTPRTSANLDLLAQVGYHGKGKILPINSGVFGWNKGAPVMDLWRSVSLYVGAHPNLRRLPCNKDQDMCCYAVNTMAPQLVIPDIRFNTPANYLGYLDLAKRATYFIKDPQERLEAIRKDHPDSYVVHWMGNNKLTEV
jgi:hypothetical protein